MWGPIEIIKLFSVMQFILLHEVYFKELSSESPAWILFAVIIKTYTRQDHSLLLLFDIKDIFQKLLKRIDA